MLPGAAVFNINLAADLGDKLQCALRHTFKFGADVVGARARSGNVSRPRELHVTVVHCM